MTVMDTAAIELKTAILVNRQSGTVRSMGEEAVTTLLKGTFGDEADIRLVSGAEIEGSVSQIMESKRYGRIIVGAVTARWPAWRGNSKVPASPWASCRSAR